jgi:hypothetical protein
MVIQENYRLLYPVTTDNKRGENHQKTPAPAVIGKTREPIDAGA